MNNPTCPQCNHRFAWLDVLKQVLGPSRQGTALWGAVCPACQADLKVPNGRALLIAFSGIFFGSQTSTLFVLGSFSVLELWTIKLFLVLGFYAIAIFIFLKLEQVEAQP